MTEENLNQVEEVQETTPTAGSESEDSAEDLASLFADDSSSQEDDKVARLEKELADLKKGMAKAFSEKGREAKEQPKQEVKTNTSAVIKNLYFNANPEAKEIWDIVEKEAQTLGKDPFELYESSTYLKGEARARAEARKVEEENKSKISKPSSGTAPKQTDISSVKPEDVDKLPPAQKVEWLKAQAKKERMQAD